MLFRPQSVSRQAHRAFRGAGSLYPHLLTSPSTQFAATGRCHQRQGGGRDRCLAVNDVNVLAAWAREHGATGKIGVVSDGLAEFTRAIGLDQDLSERGLGVRSKRYAMSHRGW